MPLYEYKCEGCGQIVDAIVSVENRDDEAYCHICGNGKLKRTVNSSYMINMPTGKSLGRENYS